MSQKLATLRHPTPYNNLEKEGCETVERLTGS